MKVIGSAIRYFLNINTIWGFMILAAFALCVGQHFLPSTLMIPTADLEDGDAQIILHFSPASNSGSKTWAMPLTVAGSTLEANDSLYVKEKNYPFLTSLSTSGDQYVVRWDIKKPGTYAFREGLTLSTEGTTTLIPQDSLFNEDGEAIQNTLTLFVNQADGDSIGSLQAYPLLVENGQIWPSETAMIPGVGHPWVKSVEQVSDGWNVHWANAIPGSFSVSIEKNVNWALSQGSIVTLESMTTAAFDYAEKGFSIALGLVAAMVLFLGLMKVGEDAGIVQVVARVFYPVIRFLYPSVPKDHPANGAILMNMTTAILGLGNAATPFGIKAMKELESLNPNKGVATDDEVMLLGYNTAGFALLPTTLIAVRKASGCTDPFEIIGTCMIAGATATIMAIIMVKFLRKIPMFSYDAAVAEMKREQAEHGEVAPTDEDNKEGGDA